MSASKLATVANLPDGSPRRFASGASVLGDSPAPRPSPHACARSGNMRGISNLRRQHARARPRDGAETRSLASD